MPPKVVVRQKTITTKTTKTPVPPAKAPVDPLTQILGHVDLGEGQRLGPDQVRTLIGLEYPSRIRILSKDQPQIVIDVINMLMRLPFDTVINYLRTTVNPKDLVMNSPLLENERERVQLEVDNLQSSIEAEEGVYQCEKCGERGEKFGRRTLAFQKQVRSADEPMSTFIRCLDCGKRWRVD